MCDFPVLFFRLRLCFAFHTLALQIQTDFEDSEELEMSENEKKKGREATNDTTNTQSHLYKWTCKLNWCEYILYADLYRIPFFVSFSVWLRRKSLQRIFYKFSTIYTYLAADSCRASFQFLSRNTNAISLSNPWKWARFYSLHLNRISGTLMHTKAYRQTRILRRFNFNWIFTKIFRKTHSYSSPHQQQ